MACSGSESGLISCLSAPIGFNNCTHADDAGVQCSAGKHWIILHSESIALVFLIHIHFLNVPKDNAWMVMFGLLMEVTAMEVEWKSALKDHGEQFVMTLGMPKMLWLFADS